MIRVHNIGGYVVKNYLLETQSGIIAIDTGYAGGFPKFKARFEKKWPLSELKYIFLTHHHDDHSGFLNELLETSDAKVILHSSAIQYLKNGRNNEPPGAGYSSLPASLFGRMKKDFCFPPVVISESRVIMVGSEDEQIFERLGLPIKILMLPGHTDDSIGLYLTDSGSMLCGDAAMNAIISVARHTIWIEDTAAFARSWDKMLSYSPKMIYPSHGNPFNPKDLMKYRNFMEGRKLIHLPKQRK
jgi:glyoxylase-like metal-dependent hydrolase (beta-lactamase superfamily II)